MRFTLNGTVPVKFTGVAAPVRLYRIDDVQSPARGVEFLAQPVALVPDAKMAQRIVELLNGNDVFAKE